MHRACAQNNETKEEQQARAEGHLELCDGASGELSSDDSATDSPLLSVRGKIQFPIPEVRVRAVQTFHLTN
jgi:hypothetical protein